MTDSSATGLQMKVEEGNKKGKEKGFLPLSFLFPASRYLHGSKKNFPLIALL
jgi:hypothetical protein